MKNLNLDIKSFPVKLKRQLVRVQRYTVFIFILSTVALYGFLVLTISSASKAEPDRGTVDTQLTGVKRLKIDQQSIDKIQQLQGQNVDVQSLFEAARDNPFQEEDPAL